MIWSYQLFPFKYALELNVTFLNGSRRRIVRNFAEFSTVSGSLASERHVKWLKRQHSNRTPSLHLSFVKGKASNKGRYFCWLIFCNKARKVHILCILASDPCPNMLSGARQPVKNARLANLSRVMLRGEWLKGSRVTNWIQLDTRCPILKILMGRCAMCSVQAHLGSLLV